MPRECDNDDCEYETFVDDKGRGRARWVHAEECEGPVIFEREIVKDPPRGSFLAFMLGQE